MDFMDTLICVYEQVVNENITADDRDAIFEYIVDICEKTSKKEYHRIDSFKKRFKYDGKTIETDIIGKDGKRVRVPMEITNGSLNSAYVVSPSDPDDVMDISKYKIFLPRQVLKRKPYLSAFDFKHEEGHIASKINPDRYKKYDEKIRRIIEYYADALPEHGKMVDEYIADIHAIETSPYGIKGFKSSMGLLIKDAMSMDDFIGAIYQLEHKPDIVVQINELIGHEKRVQLMINSIDRIMSDHIDHLKGLNSDMTLSNDDKKFLRQKYSQLIDLSKNLKNDLIDILKMLKHENKQIKTDAYNRAVVDANSKYDYGRSKLMTDNEINVRRKVGCNKDKLK